MKTQEFLTINQVREAQEMVSQGVKVASRRRGFYVIQLYQLQDCYLEVFRHSHFNVIIKIRQFTDTSYLDPYLLSISLEDLMS